MDILCTVIFSELMISEILLSDSHIDYRYFHFLNQDGEVYQPPPVQGLLGSEAEDVRHGSLPGS